MEKLKTAKRLFFIWFGIEVLLVCSLLSSAFFLVTQTAADHNNPLDMFVILGIDSAWSVFMLISIKLISDAVHENKIYNYYLASFIALLVERIIQFLVEKATSFRGLPLGYDIPLTLLVLISFYLMMKSFELISYRLHEPSFRLAGIGIFTTSILFAIAYFLATNCFKTNISIGMTILVSWLGFVIGILVFIVLEEAFFNLDKDIDILQSNA